MSFSIRSAMIAVTLLAVFLAAFFSRSEIFIACVTILMYGFVLLSLPLAITSKTHGRREFWTGFFVLSLGTLIFSNYTDSYERIAAAIVQTFQRNDQPTTYSNVANTVIQLSEIDGVISSGQAISRLPIPFPSPNGRPGAAPWFVPNNYSEVTALKRLVIILFAQLSGLIGGLLTAWVARQSTALRDLK